MILDQHGRLVWFKPLPPHTFATDFRVQEHQGRPVLTWWQGDVNSRGFGVGEDEIDSTTYRTLAPSTPATGYQADLHEFQITPQGTALITAYDPLRCDLAG